MVKAKPVLGRKGSHLAALPAICLSSARITPAATKAVGIFSSLNIFFRLSSITPLLLYKYKFLIYVNSMVKRIVDSSVGQLLIPKLLPFSKGDIATPNYRKPTDLISYTQTVTDNITYNLELRMEKIQVAEFRGGFFLCMLLNVQIISISNTLFSCFLRLYIVII